MRNTQVVTDRGATGEDDYGLAGGHAGNGRDGTYHRLIGVAVLDIPDTGLLVTITDMVRIELHIEIRARRTVKAEVIRYDTRVGTVGGHPDEILGPHPPDTQKRVIG